MMELKKFIIIYNINLKVTTRMAGDGNGWTVMLDYRTLKTPSKRPMKLPTLSLAQAIVAEWEYQVLA